ncbi:MAG: efflux RND transporter periplasmic adaptor subunit [Aureliella sp.]
MPKQATANTAPPFFGQKMTPRHFLTSRATLLFLGVLAAASIIGVALAVNSARSTASPTASGTSVENSARVLEVEVIALGTGQRLSAVQTYSGIVQPRRTSILASKFGGRVEAVNVDTGSEVAPRQVLAQLDQTQVKARIDAMAASLEMAKAQLAELENGPRQQDIAAAQSRVNEAQANLRLRQASYARVKTLYESKSVSQQEFDQATFQLDAISAQLAAARQDLHKLNEGSRTEQVLAGRARVTNIAAEIRVLESDLRDRQVLAPYAGQIQTRFVDEGTIVSPGQQILEIVEGPPYEVRVGMPISVTDCLSEDQIAASQNDLQLDIRIARTAPALNEATQTREVVLELSPESSRKVNLGSAITLSVRQREQSQGFWVPTSALTAGSRGLWAIYVARPQTDIGRSPSSPKVEATIERRQVELLRAGEEWSEVQGPISAGELVVASGTHRVTPGQIVNCIEQPNQATVPAKR